MEPGYGSSQVVRVFFSSAWCIGVELFEMLNEPEALCTAGQRMIWYARVDTFGWKLFKTFCDFVFKSSIWTPFFSVLFWIESKKNKAKSRMWWWMTSGPIRENLFLKHFQFSSFRVIIFEMRAYRAIKCEWLTFQVKAILFSAIMVTVIPMVSYGPFSGRCGSVTDCLISTAIATAKWDNVHILSHDAGSWILPHSLWPYVHFLIVRNDCL